MEWNNNNNNNTNTNTNNTNTATNIDRAEWKIQLIIKNDFNSVKDFEDTQTIYLASRRVELLMGSDTENIIDTLFNTILNENSTSNGNIKWNRKWIYPW